MEEYEKHIRHTHADKKREAWCGAELSSFDWTFNDIDHATYATQQGSYTVPCRQCVKVVIATLTNVK